MMLPSVLEKLGYVCSLVVLYVYGRIGTPELITVLPEVVLGALFIAAFVRTRP